jgi:hypothetical protein
MVEQAGERLAQAKGRRLFPRRHAEFVPHARQQTMTHMGFAQMPNVKVTDARCALQKAAGKPASVPPAPMRALLKHWGACQDKMRCGAVVRLDVAARCLGRGLAGREDRFIGEVAYGGSWA